MLNAPIYYPIPYSALTPYAPGYLSPAGKAKFYSRVRAAAPLRLALPAARAPYAKGYRAPVAYAPIRPATLYANSAAAARAATYRFIAAGSVNAAARKAANAAAATRLISAGFLITLFLTAVYSGAPV